MRIKELDQNQKQELIALLTQDFKFKDKGNTWYNQGQCPSCKKHELSVNIKDLIVVKCWRGSCGYSASLYSLYPQVYKTIFERYPVWSAVKPLAVFQLDAFYFG